MTGVQTCALPIYAMGSLKEVKSQIFLAEDLGYLSKEKNERLNEEIDKLGKKLNLFIQHIGEVDK